MRERGITLLDTIPPTALEDRIVDQELELLFYRARLRPWWWLSAGARQAIRQAMIRVALRIEQTYGEE